MVVMRRSRGDARKILIYIQVYMQEEAKGQETDAKAIFTGNWSEVVYTLGLEARFAETSISIYRFLTFLLVFLERICFSGWLLASMQHPICSVKI